MNNLILDFGGVIYRISHEKQKAVFASYGIQNFEKLYSQAAQSPLFADLEKGKISNQAFRDGVRQMIGKPVSDDEIDYLWNSILIGFSEEAVKLLEKLRKKYDLFLLSNTNSMHYDVFIKEFVDNFGYDFNTIFKKAYWSFNMGMRKPDAEIFHFVINENGFDAVNALFVDDTQANTEAAARAGLKSFLLNEGQKLGDIFDADLKVAIL